MISCSSPDWIDSSNPDHYRSCNCSTNWFSVNVPVWQRQVQLYRQSLHGIRDSLHFFNNFVIIWEGTHIPKGYRLHWIVHIVLNMTHFMMNCYQIGHIHLSAHLNSIVISKTANLSIAQQLTVTDYKNPMHLRDTPPFGRQALLSYFLQSIIISCDNMNTHWLFQNVLSIAGNPIDWKNLSAVWNICNGV